MRGALKRGCLCRSDPNWDVGQNPGAHKEIQPFADDTNLRPFLLPLLPLLSFSFLVLLVTLQPILLCGYRALLCLGRKGAREEKPRQTIRSIWSEVEWAGATSESNIGHGARAPAVPGSPVMELRSYVP